MSKHDFFSFSLDRKKYFEPKLFNIIFSRDQGMITLCSQEMTACNI